MLNIPNRPCFRIYCCKQQGLCQIPSSEAICILLAVWNYILQLQSEQRGCQQNETGMTFSHPSMLLSVSKAAICLKVSEGRQYCFSSSIRSFRASLSMWANTSLSKNGRRGPSISMEAPMRPCSEMPYQWRQKDFKLWILNNMYYVSLHNLIIWHIWLVLPYKSRVSKRYFLKELKNDVLHLFIMLQSECFFLLSIHQIILKIGLWFPKT